MIYKLAIVTAYPPSSGSLNEYGFHLVKEMAARNDVGEVVVLADKLPTGVVEPDHGPKIRVVRCWDFNDLATPLKLRKELKRELPAGVLLNVQTATFGDREIPAALGLLSPILFRGLKLRTGVLVHNLIEGIDLDNTILKGSRLRQGIVKLGGWLVSFGMTRAEYVTTTLDAYVDILKTRFPAADVNLVPHGTFNVGAVNLPNYAERKKRIVTLGKFGTYKRLDVLLESFVNLSAEDNTLELAIGGADHPNAKGYMASLEAKYASHPNITFKGYLAEDDIPEFFGQSRISVFDYTATTGSSGVLHQCASFGSVPVFPKIGDFVELCEREGLKGYHYEPDDVGKMTNAIREALVDETRSQQISTSNLEAVNELPLADVVDFHVRKLVMRSSRNLRENNKMRSATQPG